MTINCNASGRGFVCLLAAALLGMGFAVPAGAQLVTNLHQLTLTLEQQPPVFRDLRLEVTVCAASRPGIGVVIARDDSGVELLELDDLRQALHPGDRILITGFYCLLRKRDLGVELTRQPAVDNDGIHIRRTWGGRVPLSAGRHPMRLEWFNNLGEFNLELTYSLSNSLRTALAPSNFWHAVVDSQTGRTNFAPGLQAECYNGYWEATPNFNLLRPVRTGIVTNLDLEFRSRDEMTGIRFTGFFDAPESGDYWFHLRSDDGSLLFVGTPAIEVTRTGVTNPPPASVMNLGSPLNRLSERRWITVDGRVGFVTRKGRGLEFELKSDHEAVPVRLADASGLDVSRLRNARVCVTGVGRGALTTSRFIVLSSVFAASPESIQFLEQRSDHQPSLPITSVGAVQSLPLAEARRALPVRVRGVVTDSKNAIYERLMSIQDDTRGIFVVVNEITNLLPPCGESVEVQGHSGAGDFAPVIIADKITSLGAGRLPQPVKPTWTELLNGSMDVQWAEIRGLVTGVQSNTLSLLMPEGPMSVIMDGYGRSQLEPFLKSVVRIRGVLYAMWNGATREVRVGSVMMRNASIGVEVAAPDDPFDAVVKTPRELLLFDSQASAFRRVKVRGQVVYADDSQVFLEEGSAGLHLLPAGKSEVQAGDLVEAVGYPDIRRTSLLLRDARIRRIGKKPLLAPKVLTESDWTQSFLDATRVRVDGRLLGLHMEEGATVLEIQSGQYLYLARISPQSTEPVSLRAGSQLRLAGVYVGGRSGQNRSTDARSFELLLNSPAEITVLSQPSWWTLPRLLILTGGLLVVLAAAAIWITQLRRLVEQRTAQLRTEIDERERIERRHALEAERSRIARDLHDDLGASLTEISVLANTGQRVKPADGQQNLFHTIAAKARGLIAALDVIVWAVDPEENSLQSFADYVTGHTEDFFSQAGIACRFKVPVALPQMTLEGKIRHDLLMAVKEALNNIVRHAEATEAEFRVAVEEKELVIEITDNGKGFEGGGAGHGLKNLPARLRKLNGTCAVESRLGGGTAVRMRVPLNGFREGAAANTTFD